MLQIYFAMAKDLIPTAEERFGIRTLGALTSESDFVESQDQLAKAEELFNSREWYSVRQA